MLHTRDTLQKQNNYSKLKVKGQKKIHQVNNNRKNFCKFSLMLMQTSKQSITKKVKNKNTCNYFDTYSYDNTYIVIKVKNKRANS